MTKPDTLKTNMKQRFLLPIVLTLLFSCLDRDDYKPQKDLPEDIPTLEGMLREDLGDMDRLKVYNRLAFRLSNTDTERAMKYADLQQALAQREEHHGYWGKALYIKGLIHRDNKNYKSALENYLEASDRFEKAGLGKRIAHCQSNIGEIFQYNNFHGEAIPYFEKAVEYYAAAKQDRYKVLAMENLAIGHWKKKDADLAKATEIYTTIIAEQLALNEVDHDYIVKLYTNYGHLNFDRKDYASAIAQYEHALEHVDMTERKGEHRARLYSNIAEALMYQSREHYVEAKEYMEMGESVKNSTPADSRFMVQRLNMRGELALRLGEYEKALSIFERAIGIANKKVVNEALQETLNLMDRAQQAYLRAGGKLGYADSHRLRSLERKQHELEDGFFKGMDNDELLALLQKTVDGYHHEKKEARLATERDDAILFGWLKITVACLLGGLALGWVNLTATKKVRGMGERVNEMKENVRQMTERVERAKNGEKWTELVRTTLSGIRNDLEENQATWIDRSAYLRFDDATDTDGPRNGDGNTP